MRGAAAAAEDGCTSHRTPASGSRYEAKPRSHRIREVRLRYVTCRIPSWHDYAETMLTPAAISDDLRDFFHADQIATSIAGAVTVTQSEPARAAYQRLADARFDQAPVLSENRPVGWVATEDLKGHRSVRSAMIPLDECALVSAESSTAIVLQLLPHNKALGRGPYGPFGEGQVLPQRRYEGYSREASIR
jgi:hypothetical protein